LEKAIRIDSDYFIAYTNKCNFLWELNRNEEALRTAIRTTKLKKVTASNYTLEGLAYEHVGHLDKAKESYAKALDYSEMHKSDTLTYFQKVAIATLLTVVKGKEYGLEEIQRVLGEYQDRLSGLHLQFLKSDKNEIESYLGGGFLEFTHGQKRQYCFVSDKNMEEVSEYLVDRGVNVASIVGRNGGYYIEVKDKFRTRALDLGLVECTQ